MKEEFIAVPFPAAPVVARANPMAVLFKPYRELWVAMWCALFAALIAFFSLIFHLFYDLTRGMSKGSAWMVSQGTDQLARLKENA